MKFCLWSGFVLFGLGISCLATPTAPAKVVIGMFMLLSGPLLIAISIKTEEE